jgi:hypothetical protein
MRKKLIIKPKILWLVEVAVPAVPENRVDATAVAVADVTG